jgi:hypothetical protein
VPANVARLRSEYRVTFYTHPQLQLDVDEPGI